MDYKAAFRYFKEQGYNVVIENFVMKDKCLEIFALENGIRPMHFIVHQNDEGIYYHTIC